MKNYKKIELLLKQNENLVQRLAVLHGELEKRTQAFHDVSYEKERLSGMVDKLLPWNLELVERSVHIAEAEAYAEYWERECKKDFPWPKEYDNPSRVGVLEERMDQMQMSVTALNVRVAELTTWTDLPSK